MWSSFVVLIKNNSLYSVKADEKYLDVLPLMLELFNTPSEKQYVIQCQENIVVHLLTYYLLLSCLLAHFMFSIYHLLISMY